jgi:hypothetical protein
MRTNIPFAVALLLSSGSGFAQSPAPSDLAASARCGQHFTKKVPALATVAAIRSAGGGYVVATYELDGSGKASAVHVVESVPSGAFDSVVVDALERSEFTPGIKTSGCRYVVEFYRVKRTAP